MLGTNFNQSIIILMCIKKVNREVTNLVCHTQGMTKTERIRSET